MNADLSHETLIRSARDEIVATLEGLEFDPSAPLVATLAAMIAFSRSQVTIHMIEAHLEPEMRMHPAPIQGGLAQRILDDMRRRAHELIVGRRNFGDFDASTYVDEGRFAHFAAGLAAQSGGLEAIDRLATVIGETIRSLSTTHSTLSQRHYRDVLMRDLGVGREDLPYTVGDVTLWALRPDLQGSPTRRDAIVRRMQALEAYGVIHPLLMTPDITRTIDQGERLAPALQSKLGMDATRLRLVTRAQPIGRTLRNDESVHTVLELLAYEIPSHEWPKDWSGARFGSPHHQHIVSPKLIGEAQESIDALAAFTTDVLKPIVKTRMDALGIAKSDASGVQTFMNRLSFPDNMRNGPERRDFHRGMTAAVFGARKAKAFREGAEIWHRRAACAAALRKEMLAEDPHWPAVCDVWTSPDGRITAVPLTTAEELVDEGNFHNHCVGGYYEQCRSGRTHIVSMRRDSVPAGTLELTAVFIEGKLDHLTPGQFETTHRAKPDQDVQDAAKAFLRDLEEAHPVNRKQVQKHARRMARMHHDGWSETIMPLSHAVRTWPLYRPLMPRPFVEDLMTWAERSGLIATIDAALLAIAGAKTRPLGMAA